MGSSKVETTQSTRTDLAPRSGQEQDVLNLLSQLATQLGGKFDANTLANLASGQGLQPTGSDQQLVENSINATSDVAKRALEDFVKQANLGLDESLSSRGLQGSSIEAVNRAVVNRDAERRLADILSQAQGQGANALLQIPFQRAGVQLNANQALFQQLLQSATGVGQHGLQERVADINTYGQGTQTTTPGAFDYAKLAADIGKKAFSGGAG